MASRQMGAAERKVRAVLEDAGERSRALSRLLGWASEEAQLLGHVAEAEKIRELSLLLAAKQLN